MQMENGKAREIQYRVVRISYSSTIQKLSVKWSVVNLSLKKKLDFKMQKKMLIKLGKHSVFSFLPG